MISTLLQYMVMDMGHMVMDTVMVMVMAMAMAMAMVMAMETNMVMVTIWMLPKSHCGREY